MAKSKKKILIATPDVKGPIRNGGVGTTCADLAEVLTANGYEVDLLFTFEDDPTNEEKYEFKKWTRAFNKKGIGFHVLPPFEFELQHWHHWVRISYAVYGWLKSRHYDLVIFADMYGVGYYSLRARQSGLAFKNMPMMVMLMGPQIWSREANDALFNHITDLSVPLLERGSVELADVVQYATQYSLKWATDRGWKIRKAAQALFRVPTVENPVKEKRKATEIVFFGRLESRKGLGEFLDAIEEMHENDELDGRKVTLLGCEGIFNGEPAFKLLNQWMERTGIELKLVSDLGSAEAIEYLKKNPCLAVIASRAETMGYTHLECLANGIPFICSDIEPFQEVLGFKKHKAMFRSGDEKSLRKALVSGEAFVDVALARRIAEQNTKDSLRVIESALSTRAPMSKPPKKISVLITHYNRPEYLADALNSLLRQTVMPAEILVYDDASPNRRHADVVEKFKTEFAKKRVTLELVQSKTNKGPGHGRNLLVERAKSEFVFFMDDDNIALPNLIADLSKMQATSDADVITMAFLKFFDGQADLWMPRIWTPVGFDPAASTFENLMGDAGFLVRKKSFLAVGGFDDSPTLYGEDLHLLMRLAKKGANMWVCPEPLYLYRIHETNRSKDFELHPSRLRHLKEHLSHAAGGPMDSLAHILLAWTYEKGFWWIREPSPLVRKYETPSTHLVSLKKIKRKANRLQWSASDLRKELGLKNDEPFYVELLLATKGNGKLIASNKVQEFDIGYGAPWITVGVPKHEDQCELEIVGNVELEIKHAISVAVPESKMLKRLLPHDIDRV